MANPSGLPKGMEKGRRKPFHSEAKRGGAMTDGGKNAQGRYTLLKWCPCSEHQVSGSEAERRVLDCGQWWTTGGEILPAGLRWRWRREQSSVRGEAETQRGRGK